MVDVLLDKTTPSASSFNKKSNEDQFNSSKHCLMSNVIQSN
jgi:hypothetical protein